MAPKTERSQSPARRGRRLAQGFLVVFAAAFIIVSTWQVERQVHGLGPGSSKVDPNCSFAVGAFEEAVLRGLSHAAQEHTQAKADEAFEDIVGTPLEAVSKHCKEGSDREAVLAATRYRDAAEATVDSQQVSLARLRSALDARMNP